MSVSADERVMEVSVWRSDGPEGRFQSFDVPVQESQTILDVVTWIQRHADPTLAYRFACRVGMCGSCAMMVNGEPRWTCRTHVRTVLKDAAKNWRLEIAPLRNLPVIRDLVTDMSDFFDKWVRAEGVFHPTRTREDEIERIIPDSPMRIEANAGIECINCGVCHAACDVVADNPDYLGPAALNRAWTLVNDQRDGALEARLAAVSAAGGCHSCHSMGSCAVYCPNQLNPTASIAGLKRETVKSVFRLRR